MAGNLNAEMDINHIKMGKKGKTAEVMVRENRIEGIKLDLRVILLGGFNVGKSTLVYYKLQLR